MKIQFNTDKTISGSTRNSEYFSTLISEDLKKYSSHITRIEVHVSDENGIKDGVKDIRCLLEARFEGQQPIAASYQADKIEQAVSGALEKLKKTLDKILDRITHH